MVASLGDRSEAGRLMLEGVGNHRWAEKNDPLFSELRNNQMAIFRLQANRVEVNSGKPVDLNVKERWGDPVVFSSNRAF
jgi:hypothetical protein